MGQKCTLLSYSSEISKWFPSHLSRARLLAALEGELRDGVVCHDAGGALLVEADLARVVVDADRLVGVVRHQLQVLLVRQRKVAVEVHRAGGTLNDELSHVNESSNI